MKIYIFSDYRGMIDKTFSPDYKTEVEIIGSVKTGTLSIGSKNYAIEKGKARVPMSDLVGSVYSVSITAKEGTRVKHWDCGKLTRTPSGMYAPADIDAKSALIEALTAIDALRAELKSACSDIKKLKERSGRKFLGGVEE